MADGSTAEIFVGAGRWGGVLGDRLAWDAGPLLDIGGISYQQQVRGSFGKDFLEGKTVPRESGGNTSSGPVSPGQGFRGALHSIRSRKLWAELARMPFGAAPLPRLLL